MIKFPLFCMCSFFLCFSFFITSNLHNSQVVKTHLYTHTHHMDFNDCGTHLCRTSCLRVPNKWQIFAKYMRLNSHHHHHHRHRQPTTTVTWGGLRVFMIFASISFLFCVLWQIITIISISLCGFFAALIENMIESVFRYARPLVNSYDCTMYLKLLRNSEVIFGSVKWWLACMCLIASISWSFKFWLFFYFLYFFGFLKESKKFVSGVFFSLVPTVG